MKKKSYLTISEINVTNLVDVTLVILIIFMITAPLLRRGFEIDLPKAEAENIASKEQIVVSMDKSGKLFIGDDPISKDAFADELIRKYESAGKPPVLLQADRQIPYGEIISLMDIVKRAGIAHIGLVVEPGKESE